jgi:peptidylprolyl isomerase
VSQPLIEGTGAEVTASGTVMVNYSMWLWDGTLTSQTWTSNPQQLQMGGVLPGLTEGLTGKKVGSRILLVAPPDKAWGAKGNETAKIPANATIVWSIDILDVQ